MSFKIIDLEDGRNRRKLVSKNANVVISLSIRLYELKLEISCPTVALCFKPVLRMRENGFVIDPSAIRIIIICTRS